MSCRALHDPLARVVDRLPGLVETTPVEHDELYGFEKGVILLGRETTIRIEFDPHLVVSGTS